MAAFHRPILRGVGGWLVVSDDVRPAQIAFLLNGDLHVRPALAGALYRAGKVERVVMAGVEQGPAVKLGVYPAETDAAVQLLVRAGVPADRITVLPTAVTSTHDEALALEAYAADGGLKSVVVVTTDIHTRRARWLFRRALKGAGVDLQLAGAPDWQYELRSWWTDEQGLIAVTNEYLKLFHNRLAR